MRTLKVNAAKRRNHRSRARSMFASLVVRAVAVSVLAVAVSMQTDAQAVVPRSEIAMKNAKVAPFRLLSDRSSIEVLTGDVGEVGLVVQRSSGFAGTIALSVSGLPKGVTATLAPRSLLASASSTTLRLRISPQLKPRSFLVTVAASARGTTAKATVEVVVARRGGTASASQQSTTTSASQQSTTTSAPSTASTTSAPTAPSKTPVPSSSLPALSSTTSTLAAGDYSISLERREVLLPRPGAAVVVVRVKRAIGFNDTVPISIANVPNGLSVTVAEIPKDAETGEIRLETSPSVQAGSYELNVVSRSTSIPLLVNVGTVGAEALPASLTSGPELTTGTVLSLTGAAWTSPIHWTTQGAPQNVGISIFPNDTAAPTFQVTIDVGRTIVRGIYTVIFRGDSNGTSFLVPVTLTLAGFGGALTGGPLRATLTPPGVIVETGKTQTVSLASSVGTSLNPPFVALSPLPAGVTASVSFEAAPGVFNPNGPAVVITLTAASNASPGTTIVTVTVSSGGLIAVGKFPLAVLTPLPTSTTTKSP